MLVQLTAAREPNRGEAVWVESTAVLSVGRGGDDCSEFTYVSLTNGQGFFVSETPGVAGEKLLRAATEESPDG